MNKIRKTLIGGTLVLALISPFSSFCTPSQNENNRNDCQNQESEEKEKPIQYKIIEKHAIKDFLREYLTAVSKSSDTFKERIKKHGGLEKYLEVYSANHIMLLEAAFEDTESDKDIEKLAKKISTNMAKDGGAVDYSDKEVIEALEVWSKKRIELFNKLLESPNPKNSGYQGLREMAQSVYTEKTLDDWLRKQHDANEKLYDAMHGTLNGFEKYLGGDSEFNIIREETRKLYDTIPRWIEKEESDNEK